ncbi:hypothetical protein L218DRAFT_951142 [Marasmius fiardii PR-910]|nr:hypothetical protein L218DRAFT_951142 [Marasmius fiardii PR-910]
MRKVISRNSTTHLVWSHPNSKKIQYWRVGGCRKTEGERSEKRKVWRRTKKVRDAAPKAADGSTDPAQLPLLPKAKNSMCRCWLEGSLQIRMPLIDTHECAAVDPDHYIGFVKKTVFHDPPLRCLPHQKSRILAHMKTTRIRTSLIINSCDIGRRLSGFVGVYVVVQDQGHGPGSLALFKQQGLSGGKAPISIAVNVGWRE